MSEQRFHRVRLNLPSHQHGTPPNRGACVYVDDKPIEFLVGIDLSLQSMEGHGRTVVTLSFIAEVEGEVEVDEGLLLSKNLAQETE
jgi:hypothetical protein